MTPSQSHDVRIKLYRLAKTGYSILNYTIVGIPFQNNAFYGQWINDVALHCARFLSDHPLYSAIQSLVQSGVNEASEFQNLLDHLSTIAGDDYYWKTKPPDSFSSTQQHVASTSANTAQTIASPPYQYHQIIEQENSQLNFGSVFIVHGHDEAALQELARVVEKLGYTPIILREQPGESRTIIERLEQTASNVVFAIILYTECDIGRSKEAIISAEKYRARQNVLFEHGYFLKQLGRDKVFALKKGDVELPSDLNGVNYTRMDAEGGWKYKLANNMKAAGLNVDLNVI